MSTREFARFNKKLKVRLVTDEFVGATGDLSRGGMLLHSKLKFEKGAHLQLIISLPGGETEATVKVCWVRSSQP